MTQEFNRMLGKAEPMSGAERKALLKDIQQIILKTLESVPDPLLRGNLLTKMAMAFENAGI